MAEHSSNPTSTGDPALGTSSFADDEHAIELYHNSRREALFVAVLWAVALVWSVGYSYLQGYRHPPDSWVVRSGLASDRSDGAVGLIAGLPDWVAIGIVAPWLICTAVTIGFCLFFMRDDHLGTETEEGAAHGH